MLLETHMMAGMVQKEDKGQLNLYLPKPVIERLATSAAEYDRRGRTHVAEEIIIEFLDMWVELEELKRRAKERQKQSLIKASPALKRDTVAEVDGAPTTSGHSKKELEADSPKQKKANKK